MEKITIVAKDEKQSDAVKTFLKGLNIHYEIESQELNGGLDGYEQTESLKNILNSLIAHYSVEQKNLLNKRQTDAYKQHCNKMKEELQGINSNPAVWASLELMKENIKKYSPLLKKINATAEAVPAGKS
ncbi:MAG TPA: hypothetical protein VIJ57_01350 [Hanamia sp.]